MQETHQSDLESSRCANACASEVPDVQMNVPNAMDADASDIIALDENGWPKIFGDIITEAVSLDANGWPTIFGDIIMQADDLPDGDGGDDLPEIGAWCAINPNVRSRKLEVNATAQALQEEQKANGVAPTKKKRLQGKQSTKTKSLKARMIEAWHPDEKHQQEAQAPKDAKGAKDAAKGATKGKKKGGTSKEHPLQQQHLIQQQQQQQVQIQRLPLGPNKNGSLQEMRDHGWGTMLNH